MTVSGSSAGDSTGTRYGYGMNATSDGSNEIKITGDGNVTVTGNGTSSSGFEGSGYGMNATSDGSNEIKITGDGNVTVTGSGSGYGSGTGYGYGMAAAGGGVNTIKSAESAIGSPLTVTITASAGAAEKAIAMWADGGGSVNRITGHSQAGDTDSITLTATANNGQGIAMQAENGGKNIITTGAGNDKVTINGDVKGDANGNEINLGDGSNELILNGTVQSGSLNVTVDNGGTYTLVLQADTPADFVAHYGAWLTGIVSGNLIDGLSEVVFYGLDPNNLPSETSFEALLNTLHSAGVDYDFRPPEIAPQGDSPSPFSFAMPAETGAEHHTQDAQHAAGHDDMQDSPLADHDGPALMADHMTGDSPETIFSAQPDNTAHAEVPGADALGADTLDDATALAHFSEDADGQAQPLFAFLSDPADMSPGTPADMLTDLPDLPDLFEEGDDALHNGYLGNEGGDGSDFAELYTPVTLTYGDESLDSLFAAADGQDTEQDGTGLFGETGLHDMGLTDMNAALDQSHLAGPAA
ncbi:hypothetical protein, partial [Desulfovibrio sp. 1214_IL3152]|uniref:hypothetical protein n=1 Tax=Desulfovibrio sp. 1214_IL3152 TaxID=3084056 RepID=UPI002FDA26DA